MRVACFYARNSTSSAFLPSLTASELICSLLKDATIYIVLFDNIAMVKRSLLP